MNDQDQGPTVVEFAISAELAAVPAVRTALDRLSVVLAEAEMLDDNDVSGFAMGAGQTIDFSGSTIQPPGPDAAGCIGFVGLPVLSGDLYDEVIGAHGHRVTAKSRGTQNPIAYWPLA